MEENVFPIYVGREKKVINYILAGVSAAKDGYDKIEIRARGATTGKAILVATTLVNRFLDDYEISDVRIGVEELPARNNRNETVSTPYIEILIKRKE